MSVNPFDNPAARDNSALHWANKGELLPADECAGPSPFLLEAHQTFRALVLRPGFSCIGAKAAFHDDAYAFASYSEFCSELSTAGLARDLFQFAKSRKVIESEYATFVAVFREPRNVDETTFERLLWQQLHQLHTLDSRYFDWNRSVSSNTDDPQFSFSFAGCAFYVIGMHRRSSRTARTIPWPTLVFNPHEQFERLRTDGKWRKMQRAI